MALPDVGRIQSAAEKTFKSSGGSAAITLANLANNAARQSAKINWGATRAPRYAVFCDFEMAATPTAGAVIEIWHGASSSGTAATDNVGGLSGSDAAYAGYSSNLDASLQQLIRIGDFVCTAQTTGTVQKGFVGYAVLPQQYGSVVVYNKSGAAFHSSDSNCQVRFVPVEDVTEDS